MSKKVSYEKTLWYRIYKVIEKEGSFEKSGKILANSFKRNALLKKEIGKDGTVSPKNIEKLLKWSVVAELYGRGLDSKTLGVLIGSPSGRVTQNIEKYNSLTPTKLRKRNSFFPDPDIKYFPEELMKCLTVVDLNDGNNLYRNLLNYYEYVSKNKMLVHLGKELQKKRKISNTINKYNNQIKNLNKTNSKGEIALSYSEDSLREHAKSLGIILPDLANVEFRQKLVKSNTSFMHADKGKFRTGYIRERSRREEEKSKRK